MQPQFPEVLFTWTDQRLLEEWDKLTREPGDPASDAVCDEIERRHLDF